DARSELVAMTARLGGSVDAILLFYGTPGDPALAEQDLTEARRILTVNFTSAAEWCLVAAELLERQKAGLLVVAGSVAGDRGRQSNYVYGASKAGLGTLVAGVAHRLARSNARALLVKLGYVDTPMTDHMQTLRRPLFVKPDSVARSIKRAADRGR